MSDRDGSDDIPTAAELRHQMREELAALREDNGRLRGGTGRTRQQMNESDMWEALTIKDSVEFIQAQQALAHDASKE